MHSWDRILNSPTPLLVTTIGGGVSIGAGATVYYQIWCWSRRWENEGNILHKHQRQVRQNIVRKIKAPKPTPTQYCTFRSGIAVGDSKYLEILTNLCMILYEKHPDGMVLESRIVLCLLQVRHGVGMSSRCELFILMFWWSNINNIWQPWLASCTE